jgi:phosphonate transport system substrate-binding protein
MSGVALAEKNPKSLTLGIIPTESSSTAMKGFEPFRADMEKALGVPVKLFMAPDYAGVIEAMRFKKVDIVLYGNKSAMTAADLADSEIFAKIVESDGSDGYYSILVTQKDNDKINNLQDALKCDKSLDFGIGDPQSTSGFLVPTTFVFAANKVQPKECFKTVRNASHQANLLAVANKQVDVATANNRALYDRLAASNPGEADKVKEIWRSPLIAADPLCWRKDLDEDVKAKIYYGVMSFGQMGSPEQIKEERAILKTLKYGGFKPSSDLQSLPFREMQANKEIMQIEVDETLSATEKKAKISELQKKIEQVRAIAQEMSQS